MVRVSCRHTYSGGDQGQQEGPRKSVGALAATMALVISMVSFACRGFPQAHT